MSVIKPLLHRAYEICRNWKLFDEEVSKIKQRLVKNNFPMKIIDKVVNEFVFKKQTLQQQQVNNSSENKIKLYFENQMWSNSKINEKQLAEIMEKNVETVDSDHSIELNIFKNQKIEVYLNPK